MQVMGGRSSSSCITITGNATNFQLPLHVSTQQPCVTEGCKLRFSVIVQGQRAQMKLRTEFRTVFEGDNQGPVKPSEAADTLLREFEWQPLARLMAQARALREEGHGRIISYSSKV